MPNFARHASATRKGSAHVSNIALQQKENAIEEFQSGVIGPKVWQYLFSQAGISVPFGWFSTVPSSESLKKVERSAEEMTILAVGCVNRFKIDGFFWGNLGISFKQNFLTNGFSPNQYLQKGFGVEDGIYVGNPNGISLGDHPEIQKTSLGPDSFVPFVGLQMIPEAVHRVLFDKFLNPNHVVRCHCVLKNTVLVGGGDKEIRIVQSGIHASRIALGSMRRVFIE